MAETRQGIHSVRMRVLVVDDSERLTQALAAGLQAVGMTVETASDGGQALAFLESTGFDVMVLDLMMPRLDGLEVLRRLRDRSSKPRILVLSARDQVEDRVEALDLGADDYLVKPFAFDEVRARVQALSRRPLDDAAPVLAAGSLRVDTTSRMARAGEDILPLTPKEYALLELLIRRRGHVMSRAQIFEQLYASDSDVGESVIEVLMSTLRTKLARSGVHDLIETRRGFGYVVA